jgi:hypothetical protein
MFAGEGVLNHLIVGAIASAGILAVPMLMLILANRVFGILAPADFNQVSIVRRAGVVSGALLGIGVLLAPILSGRGLGFALLAGPAGSGLLQYCELLGSRLQWLLPINLLQAPAPTLWVLLAGVAAWALSAAGAIAYWRGRERLGAVAIAVLMVPFLAFSLVYAAAMVIWFVHLLNIWSIALAGLIYQRYRNSESGH